MHPYLTERMLAFSGALAPLGVIAVQHHERLDGSGYPRGLAGDALSPAGRILAAADTYRAWLEPRPHRAAQDGSTKWPRTCEPRSAPAGSTAAPSTRCCAPPATGSASRKDWPAGLTGREVQVLRLRGAGSLQPADRRRAGDLAQDGGQPRRAHLHQDRCLQPGVGLPVRIQARAAERRHGRSGLTSRRSPSGTGGEDGVNAPCPRAASCLASSSVVRLADPLTEGMIAMTELKQPAEVDFDKLMAFVFRVRRRGRCHPERGSRRDGRQARLLPGHGRLRPDHARPARRTTPAPPSRTRASGSTPRRPARSSSTTPPPGSTRSRPSTSSRSPTSPARRTCPACSRSPSAPLQDSSTIVELARSGCRLGWDEHNHDVHEGCERFFRPSYNAHLVAEWLPALDGVVAKLESGARVADIGCGYGASTIIMAEAFPNSTFVGYDYHADSIDEARSRARAAGVTDRVRFDVAPPTRSRGTGFDLVTTFDALHDMGDPVGAARHVTRSLADTGTWMIVEPMAGDHVEDNLNPVGRAYYGFSTLLCTPASLSQEVGLALGTQAGPARIRDVVTAGRLHPFRQGGRDAVQPGLGSQALRSRPVPGRVASHPSSPQLTVICQEAAMVGKNQPQMFASGPRRHRSSPWSR